MILIVHSEELSVFMVRVVEVLEITTTILIIILVKMDLRAVVVVVVVVAAVRAMTVRQILGAGEGSNQASLRGLTRLMLFLD